MTEDAYDLARHFYLMFENVIRLTSAVHFYPNPPYALEPSKIIHKNAHVDVKRDLNCLCKMKFTSKKRDHSKVN